MRFAQNVISMNNDWRKEVQGVVRVKIPDSRKSWRRTLLKQFDTMKYGQKQNPKYPELSQGLLGMDSGEVHAPYELASNNLEQIGRLTDLGATYLAGRVNSL